MDIIFLLKKYLNIEQHNIIKYFICSAYILYLSNRRTTTIINVRIKSFVQIILLSLNVS